MAVIELTTDQLLALARYLDHQRRKHPEVAGEALGEALGIIDREAVFLLFGERAERRRRQGAPFIRISVADLASEVEAELRAIAAEALAGGEVIQLRPDPCTCGVAWGTAEGPCVCEPGA